MYSPKEKEIIVRCLSISIWNHKAEKLVAEGKEQEGFPMRVRVQSEILVLSEVFKGYHQNILFPETLKVKRVGFLKRIFSTSN